MEAEPRRGVLIPRPERKPDRFVELLEASGFWPRVLPVIDIVPAADTGLASRLAAAVQSADAVIFVSRNAVESCLALLEKRDTELPSGGHYFAVGRSTAEALQRRGINAGYPADRANSEGLLELPALHDPAGRRILICRGRGGRDKLGRELTERGAVVEVLDLYHRVPTTRNREEIDRLIDGGEIRVVAIHSGEILEAFLACLSPAGRDRLDRLTFLTPGRRMADLLAGQGIKQVVVAANALPEQMVDALVHWYTGD